jgi:hypothetical protein
MFWRRRLHSPLKHCYLYADLYAVKSHDKNIFISTSVGTSDFAYSYTLICLMKYVVWQSCVILGIVYISFAPNWPLTMCISEGSVSHAASSPGRTVGSTAMKKMININKLWMHHAASLAIWQYTNRRLVSKPFTVFIETACVWVSTHREQGVWLFLY